MPAISAAAPSSASCWMSAITMAMPLAAAIRATSSPKPEAAPVITAVRPWNFFMTSARFLDLEPDAREVDVDGAGALVAPLDDDLAGRQPDQRAGDRVGAVVGGRDGDRCPGLEAEPGLDRRGRMATGAGRDRDRVTRPQRLIAAVAERDDPVVPSRELAERREHAGDRRREPDEPQRMRDRDVGDARRVAEQERLAAAQH